MAPVVAEIALEHKDTFIVAKLDAINNPKTSQKYQVRGHPTYLVFQDGDFKRLVFKVGANSAENKDNLLGEIRRAIGIEKN